MREREREGGGAPYNAEQVFFINNLTSTEKRGVPSCNATEAPHASEEEKGLERERESRGREGLSGIRRYISYAINSENFTLSFFNLPSMHLLIGLTGGMKRLCCKICEHLDSRFAETS